MALIGLGYSLCFMTIIGLAKMAGAVTVLASGLPRFKVMGRTRESHSVRWERGIHVGNQLVDRLKHFGAFAVLVVVVLGCGGPMLVFPGGVLSGEVVTRPVEDWSFVTASFVDLEFRPDDPYSVQLNYLVKDGKLYIDPREGRRWFEYLRADPCIRARFDGKVYPLIAVLVGRPGELEGFDADRFVYRLDARPSVASAGGC